VESTFVLYKSILLLTQYTCRKRSTSFWRHYRGTIFIFKFWNI